MSNKWFRFLVAVPLILLLTVTNAYQDPANIFHDESKAIAEAVISGHAAYSATGNGNEREVKHNIILSMPDEIDCIAVGPSLIMCVDKDMVGTDSFINLGVSGADLYDILAQFGLMEINNKKAKKVILCMDSYFFDEYFYSASDARNKDLMDYAKYMISLLNDEKPQPIEEYHSSINIANVEQIFSVSYFQASIDQIMRNHSLCESNNRWGIVDEKFDGSKPYYDSDGSWVYASSFQANDVDYVVEQCLCYDIKNQFAYDRHISDYSIFVFEQLIKYLKNNGVEIELFLCPLAPTLWDRIEKESDHIFILNEINKLVSDISKRYSLQVTGSYNPYELGISDMEFYDARHVRSEDHLKYFIF